MSHKIIVTLVFMAGLMSLPLAYGGDEPAATANSMGNMQGMQGMQGMQMGKQTGSFWFGHPAAQNSAVNQVITIKAGDYFFIPDHVKVRKGQTVEFKVINTGKVLHEFALGDAKEQTAHEKEMEAEPDMKMDDPNVVSVEPGQTGILKWTFTQSGQLEFACHEPGHFAAGMVGSIIVE
ncbi:MAG: hypothetical protein B7X31_13190 [Thiomonas sp. 13-66-29]|jgi:uncharacterized cupredoxin-like copper-binding protein|uniref:cupredoxin domain-containing protein n=1 Tax=Thiomonas sp. TaxID=2047785 RepID=UPI000BDD198D|nr:plastocyanin/azurin family copper-binding protein [Thiomonas sp.]OZB44374.1 MAG: hypothetical protein B7X46_09080 [Thiomonas sp. 15-66-11]OZB58789.1 MAG: hypothetical protein B7X31_13190 [Thiomonas sp. 13-66-29]